MIRREFYLNKLSKYRDTGEIKVITGIRRSGKTVLLKQLIEELKNDGIPEKNIVYISFESSEYRNIENDRQLDKTVFQLTKNIEGKIYLLFDEIQNVENWQISLNSYLVDLDTDIYITGSNSKLLSGELATFLTGRYISVNMYPFSYKELLQYHMQNKNVNELSKSEEEEIFQEYLNYGGFPSILNYEGEEKLNVLSDLYSAVILNDIIYRANIKDTDLLKRLLEFMISNIAQIFSATSISNYIKKERKTTPSTIINFINLAVNSFILYHVKREDIKQKKKLLIRDKYYVVDPGFYNLFVSIHNRDFGRLLENIIFLELIRRGYNVTVGKVGDFEVDFVCTKGFKKLYVQVSQSILDEKTRQRELRSLEKIEDNYPKYVITMDSYDFSYNGIIHLNIIDFLKSGE